MRECVNNVVCIMCEKLKLPANHLICTMSCPQFRQRVRQLKLQFYEYNTTNSTAQL